MEIIEDFVAFELYRRPPDPVKFLVEDVGSKSRSGDQSISHYWKFNLQYLRFYGGAVK